MVKCAAYGNQGGRLLVRQGCPLREPDQSRLHKSMSTVKLRAFVPAVLALVCAASTSALAVFPTTTTVLPKPLPVVDLSATLVGWVGAGRSRQCPEIGEAHIATWRSGLMFGRCKRQ